MKKATLLLFLFCRTFFSDAQPPSEKSLLWEISGKDLAAPSYLFGTIHLICPKDFILTDHLKKSLARTSQVALEMDMDDPGMMAAMSKSMFMTNGSTLKSLLNQNDFDRLNKFYKDSVGMDVSTFSRAKPFILMGPLFNKVLGCQPQSYEIELMELAGKQHSEIIGLESIEEQMAIFDTIPYTQQAKMLLAMIDSLPYAKAEFSDMISLYKTQDLPALYALTMKSEFGMDGQDEVMLFKRNRNWIDRILNMVKQKPTFIAVGAAHLGGEQGVIALLRKRGYQVKAVLK